MMGSSGTVTFNVLVFVKIIVMAHVEATIKCTCNELESIPRIDIDSEGDFKYILAKVHADRKGVKLPACMPSIALVRGYKRCNNHTEIFNELKAKMKPLVCVPLGGGKIKHEPGLKKIHIYGKSEGLGKADHIITAKILQSTIAYHHYTITAGV